MRSSSKKHSAWKEVIAGNARTIFMRKLRGEDERKREREGGEATLCRVPVVLTRVAGRYEPLQLASSFSPTTSLCLLALPLSFSHSLSLSLPFGQRGERRTARNERAPVEHSPSRARKLSQKSIDSQRRGRGWKLGFSESRARNVPLLVECLPTIHKSL